MAILNKDQIRAVEDIEEREVEVPQWGGSVRIRTLTLEQVSQIRAHAVKTGKGGKEEVDPSLQMAGLLCEGIVEPEYSFEEAKALMRKSAAAVGVIVQAINEASGLLADAVSEAEKSPDARSEPPVPVRLGARARHDADAVSARDASA